MEITFANNARSNEIFTAGMLRVALMEDPVNSHSERDTREYGKYEYHEIVKTNENARFSLVVKSPAESAVACVLRQKCCVYTFSISVLSIRRRVAR